MTATLATGGTGHFLLNGKPYQRGGVLPVWAGDTLALHKQPNDTSPLMQPTVYSDIENGDTGLAFATLADLKTWMQDNFFRL